MVVLLVLPENFPRVNSVPTYSGVAKLVDWSSVVQWFAANFRQLCRVAEHYFGYPAEEQVDSENYAEPAQQPEDCMERAPKNLDLELVEPVLGELVVG